MCNPFFDHPILNSPYEVPRRHWELDTDGQPTQKVIEDRRRVEFITPIPKANALSPPSGAAPSPPRGAASGTCPSACRTQLRMLLALTPNSRDT